MVSFRGQKGLGHAHIGLLQGFNSKFPTSIPTPIIRGVPPGLTDAKIDKLLTRHLIFQSVRLGNSYYLLQRFESIRFFRLWSAVRRLIIYHFQFNVCLNLSPFSFQQFLCIKYTTRLRSKNLCQVNLISKKYIF